VISRNRRLARFLATAFPTFFEHVKPTRIHSSLSLRFRACSKKPLTPNRIAFDAWIKSLRFVIRVKREKTADCVASAPFWMLDGALGGSMRNSLSGWSKQIGSYGLELYDGLKFFGHSL
jgi:predicted alpha/beta-fold hydrolase